MQKITKKDYEELKNKIQILSEFLNGGKGSGNFGHAGRLGKVGGSSMSGAPNNILVKRQITIRMGGKKYTPQQFKQRAQRQKEAEVLEEIAKNQQDLKGLEKQVMKNKGWTVYEENGEVCGEFSQKINQIATSIGEDDVQVMNNGKKYLQDNNGEYYRSHPTDADGFAIYTIDKHRAALDYADGKEDAICHLVVDKSNFITDESMKAIRSRLIKNAKTKELKEALEKTPRTAPVKDTTIAAMLGYDGIIRPTGDSGTEYIVIKPKLLRIDGTINK